MLWRLDASLCSFQERARAPSLLARIYASTAPLVAADTFHGAFEPMVPWDSFSIRIREADLLSASFNISAKLQAIAAETESVLSLQTSLQAHAPDVLYEVPNSRLADHFLRNAYLAITRVCNRSLAVNYASGISWERHIV